MQPVKEGQEFDPSRREYLKQQQQLRSMPKKNLSADAMIENLLSRKDIFVKKDSSPKPEAPSSTTMTWLAKVPELYETVWEGVKGMNNLADTAILSRLLMTSGLGVDVLGHIWNLVNLTVAGALTQQEVYANLALVALAQIGYTITNTSVLNTLTHAPIPRLDMSLIQPRKIEPFPGSIPRDAFPAPLPTPPVPIQNVNLLQEDLLGSFTPPQTVEDKKSSLDFLSSQLPVEPAKSSLLDLDSPVREPATQRLGKNTAEVKANLDDFFASQIALSPKNEPKPLPRTSEKKIEIDLWKDDTFGDFQGITPVQKSEPEPNYSLSDEEFDDFKSADIFNQPPPPPAAKEVFKPPINITTNLLDALEELPVKLKEDDFSDKLFSLKEEVPQPKEDKFPVFQFKEEKLPEKLPQPKDDFLFQLKEEKPQNLIQPKEIKIPEPPQPKEFIGLEVEDKYSALRSLEPEDSDGDDFGDFLTADLGDPGHDRHENLLSKPPVNIQEKCLKACLEVLRSGLGLLESIKEPQVCEIVTNDPKGREYLLGLVEVHRVTKRIQEHTSIPEIQSQLKSIWASLQPYLGNLTNEHLEDHDGPKCGVCQSTIGPAHVKYGLNNYHAPCANLYLHYVDSSLPIAPIIPL